MVRIIILCSALLTVSFAERISPPVDVSWNGSPSSSGNSRPGSSFSSNSDSDRFPITGGSSGSSRFGSTNTNPGSQTGFGFDGDSSGSSNSRFPVSGGSGSPSGSRFGSSGSIGSRGSSDSRFGSSDTRFGSSSGTGSRVSGSGSSFGRDTTPDPTKNYYVRIIASLIQFENSKSLTSTGGSCALFGKCDPIVLADLDTERPNAPWPGARDFKLWPQIYEAKSMDSFKLGVDNITKDVCGQNYREALLRVRVEDKKKLTSNAIINEFECVINRVPQDSASSADWSPIQQCISRFPAGKQTLSFRYKVYYVNRFSCGISAGSTSTTKGSFFG